MDSWTPDLSHISYKDYEFVYEPSEDSFLFLDGLWHDRETLQAHLHSRFKSSKEKQEITTRSLITIVEVGSGTSIVGTYCATLIQDLFPNCRVTLFSTDVNPKAAHFAKLTNERNFSRPKRKQIDNEDSDSTHSRPKIISEVILSDLLSGLRFRGAWCPQIILFNPPYVPTPSEEVSLSGLSAAWAGGQDGREVIDRFLKEKGIALIKEGAILYMIVVKENKPEEVSTTLDILNNDSCGLDEHPRLA
eukprot:g4062.t1